MSDYSELKRLANCVPRGPWEMAHANAGHRGWEVKQGIEQIAGDIAESRARYIAALSPAVVLGLIAEIERLRAANNTVECRFEVSEDTLSTIRGCLRSAEGDIDHLKAECEGLREVMACVVSEIPRGYSRGNAPGHCHDIPGIWDRDNGDKAGKECGWCKVWNAAIALSKGERP